MRSLGNHIAIAMAFGASELNRDSSARLQKGRRISRRQKHVTSAKGAAKLAIFPGGGAHCFCHEIVDVYRPDGFSLDGGTSPFSLM